MTTKGSEKDYGMTKLDYEAAKEWAQDMSGLHSIRTLNLAACFLKLLEENEEMRLALFNIKNAQNTHTPTSLKIIARAALAKWKEKV